MINCNATTAPAPVEILFHALVSPFLDLLLVFFFLLAARVLAAFLAAAFYCALVANEYYDNKMNLCVQKKNNGQFLPNCVLIIASVTKPTSPIILSASISIKVNHNMDTLYPFSFD